MLGVISLGYNLYEQDKQKYPSILGMPIVAVVPPVTEPRAPAGTTPTGLPHDPLVDYWDDPAINFPGAPTKPIPHGMTALCQADCFCPSRFPYDPYKLATFSNRTAPEMQQTALKMNLGGCDASACPGAQGNTCNPDGSMSYSCCTSNGECGCTECGTGYGCSPSNTDCY